MQNISFNSSDSVILQKIEIKNSGAKSFALSLLFHSIAFGAVLYITPEPPKKIEEITISLLDFNSDDGDINKLESPSEIKPTQPIKKEPIVQKEPIIKKEIVAKKEPKQTPKELDILADSIEPSQQMQDNTPLASAEAVTPQTIEPTSSPSGITTPPEPVSKKTDNQKSTTDGAALGHIRAMIEKALVYPAMARRLKIEGIVDVSFVLNPNGSVKDVSIVNSSGSTVLDKKALETVLALSGSYPALGKTLRLAIPIAFELK